MAGKVRGSKTVSAKARGSSRKRGGRLAEAIGADVDTRADRVVLKPTHVLYGEKPVVSKPVVLKLSQLSGK